MRQVLVHSRIVRQAERMKLYSDFAGHRIIQVLADLVALAVIVLAIWAAVVVHAAIVVLAGIGKNLEDAGSGLRKTMTDAGNTLGGVPLIGHGIRTPFDAASDAGKQLAQAGQTQQDIVNTSATVIAVAVAVIPILLVLYVWLRPRFRFARRATSAYRVARLPEGNDVLALRALVSAKPRDLHDVDTTPVGSWRRGDPVVIRALAQLELREAGVRLV
jgi:hypothetical protein